MTLISNKINSEKFLDHLVQNLTNIDEFIKKMPYKNLFICNANDEKLLMKFIVNLSYNNNNFDINTLFENFKELFNDNEEFFNNFKRRKSSLLVDEISKQFLDDCKLNDHFDLGLVKYSAFKRIFQSCFKEKNNNKILYDNLVFYMKNLCDGESREVLGLFNLNYKVFERQINENCENKRGKSKSLK